MPIVKFKRTTENKKIITEVDGFRVGNIYCLTHGYYEGHFVKLEYIAPNCTIMIDGERNRQIAATLIQGETKINSVLHFLEKR